MKKIISMLCVIAMMFSFAVMSASAANNAVTLVKNEAASVDGKLAFDVVVANSDGVKSVTLQLSYADFLAKNSAMADGDFTASKVSASGANPVAAKDFITSTYTNTDGAHTEVTMFTVFINEANFKNDATFALTAASKVDGVTLASGLATNNFAIKAPVSVKTIAVSDSVAVTTDAAATDCQIGTGIGLTANAGEAVFTKMIWALTSGENKLFSKVIELPGISGEFKVAATFINGSHNEKFDVEVVESVAIDAVNAIFTDGTADYFTDATDAALKAE
jgi:hypothetical protein